MQATILRRSSALEAASRQRWTAQLPKLPSELDVDKEMEIHEHEPMGHHLETTSTDSVHDLTALFSVRNLQLLLQEDGGLLVGRFDNSSNEDMVGRGGRGVKKREKVDGLESRTRQYEG